MNADDLDKEEKNRKATLRLERREAKKHDAPITINDNSDHKRARLTLSSSTTTSSTPLGSGTVSGSSGGSFDVDGFFMEREKMRMEIELEKERMRIDRDRERDDAQRRRDETFMKLIQDQMISSQAMLQATQSMMVKIVNKLGGDEDFPTV